MKGVLRPEIRDVRVLEFNRAEAVYEMTRPECDRLRAWLEQWA